MDYNTINSLRYILNTFYDATESNDFRSFLNHHLIWISSIKNDGDLYNPITRNKLNEIRIFLKEPEYHFEEFIELFREYMDIKRAFKPYQYYNFYEPMSAFFEPIVSDLEYILDRTPPCNYAAMHGDIRDFYRELNAYILQPQRVKKIASNYGIDPSSYLDAIDV